MFLQIAFNFKFDRTVFIFYDNIVHASEIKPVNYFVSPPIRFNSVAENCVCFCWLLLTQL